MPATAFTVVVPLNVAPPGFTTNAMVTGPLNVVATFSAESCALTTIVGERFVPATALLGRVRKMTCVAIPAVAVAEKVAGDPVSPATLAETDCAPAVGPSVHVFVATPRLLVSDDVLPSEPAPTVTAHVTATPAAGLPDPSVTVTLSGFCSASVAAAD